MVVHRHILVDGKIVDRPSFRVKPGQLVHVKERSEGMEPFQVAAAGGHVDVLPKLPPYLEVELDKLHARLIRRPKRPRCRSRPRSSWSSSTTPPAKEADNVSRRALVSAAGPFA